MAAEVFLETSFSVGSPFVKFRHRLPQQLDQLKQRLTCVLALLLH